MGDFITRLDAAQRRRPLIAFPIAVFRKAGDDQVGLLAVAVSCYAFLAVFPLLLVFVTVLGVVLKDDASAQQSVLHSALTEFPIIGTQLRANVHSLNRTGVGLIIGLVGTIWGARGLSNAAQTVCTTVWAVPYTKRPPWLSRQLRSVALLSVIGLATFATGTISSVAGVGGGHSPWIVVLGAIGSVIMNSLFFTLAYRLATPPEVPTRYFVRGAFLSAVAWQLLLALGGYLVAHELRHAEDLYGLFGIVLGLFAWLQIQARIAIMVLEADCVRERRLWPRTLDGPKLVPADVDAFAHSAKMQQRRASIRITVEYQDPGAPDRKARIGNGSKNPDQARADKAGKPGK